ncbi:MAG: TetR/AcrR family transcriptional regulator [Terriglobia bacterium]
MPIKTELRRLPRQSRGRRRVEALLNAAAAEISDAGYEAATMCSIATRAGASIGSLYQFFLNKAAIVQALRRHYCDEFELMWAPLASEARHLSWEELVIRLVDSTVLFVERHPAFLALLDAPASTHAPVAVRERFQQLVATMILARRPRMSPEKALRLATMTLQMIKAMNFLCRDLSPRERPPYVREFKMLLQRYLECRIENHDHVLGSRQ